MSIAHTNIGHADALARRISGAFALLAGIVAIDGFFRAMPFLTWLVLAFMFSTGLFFLLAGYWRGGTGAFGLGLMLLAVADGWLAVMHYGAWALGLGVVVAADGYITAQLGWSPLNALFHTDTHQADGQWTLPHAGAH